MSRMSGSASFRAHSFASYEQANLASEDWNEDVARRRVHGTHGEVVAVRAGRDRDALGALPAVPYLVVERTTRIIARDGLFSFEGRRYAVPDAKPGERVELLLGAQELEAYRVSDGSRLARHRRGAPAKITLDPGKVGFPRRRAGCAARPRGSCPATLPLRGGTPWLS